MRHGSFHLSAVAASLAVLALMAPSSSQAQAPSAQTHAQTQKHGSAGTATHRTGQSATRTGHGVAMQRGQSDAKNRTAVSGRTVTNRDVVTTRRAGATTVAGGGYVSPSYSGTYYGGGAYAGGNHDCWWYRHHAPGNIPSWCGASYGYAAPSGGYSYSYGYTSGPTRFGTTSHVNREVSSSRQTTVTRQTNMTANRQPNKANRQASMTASASHGGTGGAKMAGMGHHARQQVTH